MIGNPSTKDLRHLLQFITGSSVCSSKIYMQFNAITRLARRPIAHTCDSTVELSTAYQNYDDFIEEFLNHTEDEFSWKMDALCNILRKLLLKATEMQLDIFDYSN